MASQDLQARTADEDENRIVHDAAKVSLTRCEVVDLPEETLGDLNNKRSTISWITIFGCTHM